MKIRNKTLHNNWWYGVFWKCCIKSFLKFENINYYRVPCDTCDLNYDKYFKEGEEKKLR